MIFQNYRKSSIQLSLRGWLFISGTFEGGGGGLNREGWFDREGGGGGGL